jgi:putative peptidoglycan binding protein
MSPDRIEEIQSALAKFGYYQGLPTGKWDEASKASMRQCQAANGFEPTGLPDAKSLMKLGLGSHPLPLELDPTAQSRVNLETPPKSTPSTEPSSNEKTQQPDNHNDQN